VRHSARAVLNLLRSISELIWAVFFVARSASGRSPGACARRELRRHPRPALRRSSREHRSRAGRSAEATGASRLQVIAYAMFPQALPQFVTYNLYWFEVGVRSATVLGMVGAGGIGFELVTTIRLFEWRETGVVLLLILAMVTIIDLASTWIRARIY
jgi:phosphonate transport system permease protein